MTGRPIIFSAEMVRAILSGQKTQTRRVVKRNHLMTVDGEQYPILALCPHGQPGSRLWVREACRADAIDDEGLCCVRYLADQKLIPIENTREAADKWVRLYWYRGKEGLTVPPIHMPRWASRITLEITDVRVERLQDISEADAKAEGVSMPDGTPTPPDFWSYQQEFRHLWEQINGPCSWDANPFVWVVTFRRIDHA